MDETRRPSWRARIAPVLGSLLFLFVAPGTVAVWIPWRISRWRTEPLPAGLGVLRVVGAALVITGAAVLLDSFGRFALKGLGTPAPVMPPKQLVVSGLYRHVRNPMYVALLSVVLGQALLLGQRRLFVYAASLWTAFHLFVVLYEEPTLRVRFGHEYERYRAEVRRWWPRLGPWRR